MTDNNENSEIPAYATDETLVPFHKTLAGQCREGWRVMFKKRKSRKVSHPSEIDFAALGENMTYNDWLFAPKEFRKSMPTEYVVSHGKRLGLRESAIFDSSYGGPVLHVLKEDDRRPTLYFDGSFLESGFFRWFEKSILEENDDCSENLREFMQKAHDKSDDVYGTVTPVAEHLVTELGLKPGLAELAVNSYITHLGIVVPSEESEK